MTSSSSSRTLPALTPFIRNSYTSMVLICRPLRYTLMSRSVPISLMPPAAYSALKALLRLLRVYVPGITTSPITCTCMLRVSATERLNWHPAKCSPSLPLMVAVACCTVCPAICMGPTPSMTTTPSGETMHSKVSWLAPHTSIITLSPAPSR